MREKGRSREGRERSRRSRIEIKQRVYARGCQNTHTFTPLQSVRMFLLSEQWAKGVMLADGRRRTKLV